MVGIRALALKKSPFFNFQRCYRKNHLVEIICIFNKSLNSYASMNELRQILARVLSCARPTGEAGTRAKKR